MRLCPQCGVRVLRKLVYCAEHTPVKSAQWRHERALKGGTASARAARRRAVEAARGLLPADAYKRGYGNGYRRAYMYWQQWAKKALRHSRAA